MNQAIPFWSHVVAWILGWSMGHGLFADELGTIRPTRVKADLITICDYSHLTSNNRNQRYSNEFAQVGDTFSFFAKFLDDLSGTETVNQKQWQATQELFRRGEVIHHFFGVENGKLSWQLLTLYSPAITPDMVPPSKGDIFHFGFPLAGCIDGYFFEDYFPKKNLSIDRNTPDAPVVSDTKFGRAKAYLDYDRGNLPRRIIIEKSADHLIYGNRRLGDGFGHSDFPESRLTSYQIEFNVHEFGTADTGEHFFQKCELEIKQNSLRGYEGKMNFTWTVSEISFNTNFDRRDLLSVMEIKDRVRVQVAGAEQLPYFWSAKEHWAVPDERYAAAPVAVKGSKKFYYVAAGVVILLIAMAVFYWKTRR